MCCTNSLMHIKEPIKKTLEAKSLIKTPSATHSGLYTLRINDFLAFLFATHFKRTTQGGCWFQTNYFQIVSDFPTYRNKRHAEYGQIKAFPPAASQPLRETYLDAIMTLLQSFCCFFFKHWTTEIMFLIQFPLK